MSAELGAETVTMAHNLAVIFNDGKSELFERVESSWIDNNILRLRTRDGGKTKLYAMPLVGIRLWHRELT